MFNFKTLIVVFVITDAFEFYGRSRNGVFSSFLHLKNKGLKCWFICTCPFKSIFLLGHISSIRFLTVDLTYLLHVWAILKVSLVSWLTFKLYVRSDILRGLKIRKFRIYCVYNFGIIFFVVTILIVAGSLKGVVIGKSLILS